MDYPTEHYATDGQPQNVSRTARYHVDAEGITVCGECAVKDAMGQHGGWNTAQSEAILRKYGYEREPYDATREERDWCVECGEDFAS